MGVLIYFLLGIAIEVLFISIAFFSYKEKIKHNRDEKFMEHWDKFSALGLVSSLNADYCLMYKDCYDIDCLWWHVLFALLWPVHVLIVSIMLTGFGITKLCKKLFTYKFEQESE
jgi:hypothetical protein